MSRGRWIGAAVGLLLGAAGVVVGVDLAGGTPTTTPAVTAAAPAAAQDSAECRRVTAEVRRPSASAVDGPGERVAVLGNSYTSGYGLLDPQAGYAYVLARALGWRAAVDGFPGSGFTTDATCPGERYGQRVDRIPADADLVLVEGGLNDLPHAQDVGAAADTLLALVRGRVPGATVVLVGPPLVPGLSAPAVRQVSADLGRSAAAHGATYVDPTGWSLPYLGDGVHLTGAGHQQFADLLRARLAQAHLVAAPPGATVTP